MRVWRIECVYAVLLNVNVRKREYALYIVCSLSSTFLARWASSSCFSGSRWQCSACSAPTCWATQRSELVIINFLSCQFVVKSNVDTVLSSGVDPHGLVRTRSPVRYACTRRQDNQVLTHACGACCTTCR